MKVTNIAQALACARKMRAGKRCTQAEMKSTALILEQALRTAKANSKQIQKQADFLERQMERLSMFRT